MNSWQNLKHTAHSTHGIIYHVNLLQATQKRWLTTISPSRHRSKVPLKMECAAVMAKDTVGGTIWVQSTQICSTLTMKCQSWVKLSPILIINVRHVHIFNHFRTLYNYVACVSACSEDNLWMANCQVTLSYSLLNSTDDLKKNMFRIQRFLNIGSFYIQK